MDIYLPAVLEVIPLGSKNLRSGAGGVTLLVELDGVDARQASAALLDEGIAIGIPADVRPHIREVRSGDLLMGNPVGHRSGVICRRRLDVPALVVDGLVEARILQLGKGQLLEAGLIRVQRSILGEEVERVGLGGGEVRHRVSQGLRAVELAPDGSIVVVGVEGDGSALIRMGVDVGLQRSVVGLVLIEAVCDGLPDLVLQAHAVDDAQRQDLVDGERAVAILVGRHLQMAQGDHARGDLHGHGVAVGERLAGRDLDDDVSQVGFRVLRIAHGAGVVVGLHAIGVRIDGVRGFMQLVCERKLMEPGHMHVGSEPIGEGQVSRLAGIVAVHDLGRR